MHGSWTTLSRGAFRRSEHAMPKVLIFVMNDADTAQVTEAVVRAFSSIGWRTVVCDYAALNGSDPRRLGESGGSLLTLSDAGFDSIPMLSSPLYRERYGDDLDFEALLGMRLGRGSEDQGQTSVAAELLHPDSAFRQKLYGFAARAEELLGALAPDLVVIQQGGEVISRVLLAKTLKLGLPWLIFESSFFPRHILLDPCGQHFMRGYNQIDADIALWKNTPLTPIQQQHVDAFVADWKAQRTSKYEQAGTLSDELADFLATPGPVLFVPMQVPGDANVHYGLGAFDSLADYYQSLVDALPEGWRAVFKPHPFDASPIPWRPPSGLHFYVATGANIHDLIGRADAVALFSSNVGLEALLYGKPVLVGGKPCYGSKGLTLDIERREQLADFISASPNFRPDQAVRDRFLHYLLHDYLIPEGSGKALRRKLDRVGVDQRGITDPRAPFCDADPVHVRAQLPLLARYRCFAEQDHGHDDILRRLGLSTKPELLPLTDKDRPMPWLHQEDPSLVAAYSFTARLARGLDSVLDFGCGDGFGAWLLARSGLRVMACAASEGMLDYARCTWQHRRIQFLCASPGAVIEGALPPNRWKLAIILDSLSAAYRPDELLVSIARSLSLGGALLVRIADPKRIVAANRFCPRRCIDMRQIVDRCQVGGGLIFMQSFYQKGIKIHPVSVPNCDHQWLLFCRGATEEWRRRLNVSLAASQSMPRPENSPARLFFAALRRRYRWLRA